MIFHGAKGWARDEAAAEVLLEEGDYSLRLAPKADLEVEE